MTHHLLSARCVKEQLRRPGSCSEGPLSNVHDHGTYSRYHYISMISVCWGGMILFSIYCLRVVLMSFLAIPHNGKLCDPPACFLKNKKDGVACRPSCRHTANPAACSIAGRKSWNKALLPATSLHAANFMLVSARYFIPLHSPINFFWNSFPENGRRTIAITSWREAA